MENSRIVELYAPLIKLADTMESRQNTIDHTVESYVQNVEEADNPEAQVLYSIMACKDRIHSGKFATSWVTEYYNSEFDHDWARPPWGV